MINVIESRVEEWKQEGYDILSIWKHIAKCARVCYQSKPKNKDESDYDFLVRTIFRGVDVLKDSYNEYFTMTVHGSVLEHGTVRLRIPNDGMIPASHKYVNNPYSEVYSDVAFDYITTNMRVLFDNKWFDDLHYIDTNKDRENKYYDRTTINIITDIGVSREFNRHRSHSISEESTRYCAYDKDKFNNNISVIKLPWIETKDYNEKLPNNDKLLKDWDAIDWYIHSICIANTAYKKLREFGWTAQQAREVLPLSTKTQLVHTTFNYKWYNWITLRYNEVSGKVHPCMKVIANEINNCLKNKY